ncbi:hypothetical protein Egran_04342 [Elaphomyces granulatus]|uniref:SWR1-complex protein 5 n=1 Tax=Elaphomyces granulatus TaxID=519963 RepID=A0A232LUY8_9EURO|nr:hypothetical protein Egran_04342 [Elaphomyces granulatus]
MLPQSAISSALDPDVNDDGESYDSAEDEDFQRGTAEQDDADLSSSDAEDEPAERRPLKRRKLTGPVANEPSDSMELDSGDEATIRKAKKRHERRRRNKHKGNKNGQARNSDDGEDEDVDFDDDDEEGGEGGFVKTRSMRIKVQEERKPLAKIDGASIDVDALWQKMNASSTGTGLAPAASETGEQGAPIAEENKEINGQAQTTQQQKHQPVLPSEEMIKIKRTYKFAGELITEEKLVPKDSAEAKLFLSEANGETATTTEVEDTDSKKSALKLRRPLRKASRFDPNPVGLIKKNWEKQPAVDPAAGENGPKLNTVEKSKLDWATYVDQAGIKDELNVHSRAKEGYLGRMDFLDRVEAKREEERRNVRLKQL